MLGEAKIGRPKYLHPRASSVGLVRTYTQDKRHVGVQELLRLSGRSLYPKVPMSVTKDLSILWSLTHDEDLTMEVIGRRNEVTENDHRLNPVIESRRGFEAKQYNRF